MPVRQIFLAMSKDKPKTKEQPVKIAPEKSVGPPKSAFRGYLESFSVTLIMAIFGMTFVVQAVTVPTGSMQNTISIGDHLLVNRFIYPTGGHPLPFLPQREIERGDVVVFKYPGNKVHPEYDSRRNPPTIPYQENYVKRVIGLPGDEVEFRNNQVFINGQLLPEHRIIGDAPNENSPLVTKEFEPQTPDEKYSVYYSKETTEAVKRGENLSRRMYDFGVPGKPMKVPENQYFMMGDSRDDSEDSRTWGFVDRNLIIGRAMFVYWSCDKNTSDESIFGCLTHPRFNRIGKMIQ